MARNKRHAQRQKPYSGRKRIAATKQTGECPAYHMVGVKCKLCGQVGTP